MGEIADYYTDHWVDEDDEDDAGDPIALRSVRTRLQCRYCKRRRLQWLLTDMGWRLADSKGNVHACDAYRAEKG